MGRFRTPFWHWTLPLQENRFIPKRARRMVTRGSHLLRWEVSVPIGFSLSGPLSYIDCSPAELRRQNRRLAQFTEKAIKSPDVWCSLAHSFPSPFAVRVNFRTHRAATCWLILTDGKNPLGYAQRTLDFPNKRVAHDYLALVPDSQKGGYGARLLANALSVYPRMGISEITLTAGLTAGSSVWPRLGFLPESEDEWKRLRKRIVSNASKLSNSVHQAYSVAHGRSLSDAIDAIVLDDDPLAIFDLVDLDPGGKASTLANLEHGIAGKLLSGGHWRGRLEFNGAGHKRLLTYLKNKNIAMPVVSA